MSILLTGGIGFFGKALLRYWQRAPGPSLLLEP
jgi:hypothetical protein